MHNQIFPIRVFIPKSFFSFARYIMSSYRELIFPHYNEANMIEKISTLKRTPMKKYAGNDVIYYFFFDEMVHCKARTGVSFIDFVSNKDDYLQKPAYRRLAEYMDRDKARYKNHSEIKRLYCMHTLYHGSIKPMSIMQAYRVINRYIDDGASRVVLDPFMGWGGRLLAAHCSGASTYIGIDSNLNLKTCYDGLLHALKSVASATCNFQLIFDDVENIAFDTLHYDMVLTSPPYYNIEVYPHMSKKSTAEWDGFYTRVFQNMWDNLSKGGVFAVNVNAKIYNAVLLPLLGQQQDTIPLNMACNGKRMYEEYFYVWKKFN
jgi:hypothetical protein